MHKPRVHFQHQQYHNQNCSQINSTFHPQFHFQHIIFHNFLFINFYHKLLLEIPKFSSFNSLLKLQQKKFFSQFCHNLFLRYLIFKWFLNEKFLCIFNDLKNYKNLWLYFYFLFWDKVKTRFYEWKRQRSTIKDVRGCWEFVITWIFMGQGWIWCAT